MPYEIEEEVERANDALDHIEKKLSVGVPELAQGARFGALQIELTNRLKEVFVGLPDPGAEARTRHLFPIREVRLRQPRRSRPKGLGDRLADLALNVIGLAPAFDEFLSAPEETSRDRLIELPRPMYPGSGPLQFKVRIMVKAAAPGKREMPRTWWGRVRASYQRLRRRAPPDREYGYRLVSKQREEDLFVPAIPPAPGDEPLKGSLQLRRLELHRGVRDLFTTLDRYEKEETDLARRSDRISKAIELMRDRIDNLSRVADPRARFKVIEKLLEASRARLPGLESQIEKGRKELDELLLELEEWLPGISAGALINGEGEA